MADEQDQRPQDAADQPAGPEGPADEIGQQPVSQDDIDRLFADQAVPAPAPGVGAEAQALLGGAAAVLEPLARQGAEVLGVGLETVTGKRVAAQSLALDRATAEAVVAAFAETAHLGLDLRLQLDEVESQPVAALVPLAGFASWLSLELDAEQLQDADFADGQLQLVSTAMRELLDLVSLTLFSDGLSQAELTLAGARFGAAEETVALVADAAPAGDLLTLAFSLTGGAEDLAVTLVLPASLPQRLAERLSDETTEQAPDAPLEVAPPEVPSSLSSNGTRPPAEDGRGVDDALAAQPRGFGLTSDPDDIDGKISPIRPGAAFGARKGDDVDVHPVRFPSFGDQPLRGGSPQSLDLIMDVQMRVSVELGRSSMSVEDVLSLGPGSVVELNKLAGEPVDILVNERLIARGEVVVVDENFGVRVTEIISPRRRAQALGR